MNIFGIGLPEMVVIFVLALLIFGPKKLPEIGRSLGKTLKSLQEASKEFESEIKKGVADLEKEKANPSTQPPAALVASESPEVSPDRPTELTVDKPQSDNGVVPEAIEAVPSDPPKAQS